ncbi:hypothetical protein BP6252_09841 [Coleophoma cylindrospora]|uniref:Uncharacterized protein n=1 Tax=Coleophoma cylindrospora TaxID=1849047 RepID=A0A3D8QWN8_9HELO|nr:hypothetical protein BP6252_09841 [Coleophoma cylindrospora]
MAGSNFNSLHVTKRTSPTKYSNLPAKDKRREAYDEEKYVHGRDSFDSEDDSDCSSSSSIISSRDTSGSYGSHQPILTRKPSAGSQRPSSRYRIGYRIPNRIVRYMCLALISTIVIFIFSLARMSVVSSRNIESGDINRPPPPPPAWESFKFLSRYYGGIRTLVPLEENVPEYPRPEDEPNLNETVSEEHSTPIREIPVSIPFSAYGDSSSVQECFLDRQDQVRVPQLQHYQGRPSGFPENVVGSYELLGLPEDICFERYGRLGPYGLGYSPRSGGTGTGQHGDFEGSDAVWADTGKVDYRHVDWADAQRRCYQKNSARFQKKEPLVETSKTFSTLDHANSHLQSRNNSEQTATAAVVNDVEKLPRTAVVIRTWDEFEYKEENVLQLRAMISELSLGSGGEYDVHLLVQVKDEAKHPIWADEQTYQEHLNASVPEEFRGIATLWSTTQMLMLYQGIFDVYPRGPDLPAHGSYRGLQMAMQHFAHIHPEYDYFWHWEMDIRFTGHYYNLFSRIDTWTKQQPRKGLWERNSRFYVPSVHGSWEDFKQMVRVQTEMGTDNPNNMWSGVRGSKSSPAAPKGDKPIWGPERPHDSNDWFEIENDPKPPTSYEKDKYVWGVGENADLVTFNPLFDPEGTTWLLAADITGYNNSEGLPPRRAAIITSARMSKRLLTTMHRETAFKNHHAFSEMWAPTAALHHGYKAVYVPHPMFVDREWPTEYLTSIMNAGRNGATGGARTSIFGEREHNLKGMTWYYNAGFAPNLWKRWLGLKVDNEGGEQFEMTVDEGRTGNGVNQMRGGEGRMCLPPMLIHPVKEVVLPVEGSKDEEEVPESDPSA